MDLFTTAILLAGAKPPANKLIDGIDLRPALFNQSINDRYFRLTFNQSSITHLLKISLGRVLFQVGLLITSFLYARNLYLCREILFLKVPQTSFRVNCFSKGNTTRPGISLFHDYPTFFQLLKTLNHRPIRSSRLVMVGVVGRG